MLVFLFLKRAKTHTLENFSKLINYFKETENFATGHCSKWLLLWFMRFKVVSWWMENILSMNF